MLKVLGLLVLLSLSNSIECDEDGYTSYLASYDFKGRTNPEEYKKDHVDTFLTRCRSLNEKKKTCGFADFTALMDWSDDELDELGKLNVEYSGSPIMYDDAPVPSQNEMSVEKKSRVFDKLEDYNSPEKKCSTSWATAAIKAAEAVLDYKVELSEEQLFTCLPKDLGFADGCGGIHPKKVMDYLLEEGLVEKKDFNGCDKLDGLKKYRFMPNTPSHPTAGGLMNLLATENKPAFVMMAIDIKKLVNVKDMSNVKDSVKCAGYQPSLYGVLTGYKYYPNSQSGWWEVVTHIVPGEEVTVKIPITSNMANANYAGIAAYAFTLNEPTIEYICNESIYPTIDDIPSDATSLTFTANSYNSVTSVDFTRFAQLRSLVIEDNSFQNCHSVIVDNTRLDVYRVGSHCFQQGQSNSRRLAAVDRAFIIRNAGKLRVFTVGSFSMGNFRKIDISGTSSTEVSVTIGQFSFLFLVEVKFDEDSVSFGAKLEFTILSQTPTPTPTPIACGGDLVISTDDDCDKLNNVIALRSITVNEGMCNTMTSDLVIADSPCLEEIIVKKNALNNLNSLTIDSNNILVKIETENGIYDSSAPQGEKDIGAFLNVTRVVIKNLPELTTFTIGERAFFKTESLTLSNLPNLSQFITGMWSLSSVTSLSMTDLTELTTFSTDRYSFQSTRSLTMSNLPKLTTFKTMDVTFQHISSLDLSIFPELQSFETGTMSFWHTTSLVLTNLNKLRTLSFGTYSFQNAGSLVMSLPELRTFETKQQAFQDATTVTFNTPLLTSITIGQNSFVKSTSLSLSNCLHLTSIYVGDYCFSESASTLSLNNLPELTSINMAFYSFKKATSIVFEGLPRFNSFEVGQAAFTDTTSITLNNVPFTGGYYSVQSGSSFQSITCDSFTVTGTSALPNKMKSC